MESTRTRSSHRKVHDCDNQDLPQLLTIQQCEQQHPAGKAYKKIDLVVCTVDSMAEEKCDKCSFVGDKAAMQQHRKRKIPCDAMRNPFPQTSVGTVAQT